MQAKPILKWAGGKSQLAPIIEDRIPEYFKQNSFTYVEPFIGGGAMYFWLFHRYRIKRAIINDANPDLINCYICVRDNVQILIEVLEHLQLEYREASVDEEAKKQYYYNIRSKFNSKKSSDVERAAELIFLNKTCFNGLYRVNRRGEFNVPIGSYKNPTICDPKNLNLVSKAFVNTEILNCDFSETVKYADKMTLYYLDPPYKPLNETSSFNAYAKGGFGDDEQIRLAEYCKEVGKRGGSWVLSNSDVNSDQNPNLFFDELYRDFDVRRVQASRAINSVSSKRGKLNELLISNRK